MKLYVVIFLSLLAVGFVQHVSGLRYPADVLNLAETSMELQFPDTSKDGGIHTIKQPELLTYSSNYFYTNEDDPSTVVFWAPENGGVTDNGSGPRTELTEPKNFFTFSGKHTMTFTQQVKATDPKGVICIGQIKGDSYDSTAIEEFNNSSSSAILRGSLLIVVELMYSESSGAVTAHVRNKQGDNINLDMGHYSLNEKINMMMSVDGYEVTVKSDKASHTYSYDFWKGANYGMHFKVGVYDQGEGSSSSKGGKTKLSNLKITHSK